jgi:hypothetical protein
MRGQTTRSLIVRSTGLLMAAIALGFLQTPASATPALEAHLTISSVYFGGVNAYYDDAGSNRFGLKDESPNYCAFGYYQRIGGSQHRFGVCMNGPGPHSITWWSPIQIQENVAMQIRACYGTGDAQYIWCGDWYPTTS